MKPTVPSEQSVMPITFAILNMAIPAEGTSSQNRIEMAPTRIANTSQSFEGHAFALVDTEQQMMHQWEYFVLHVTHEYLDKWPEGSLPSLASTTGHLEGLHGAYAVVEVREEARGLAVLLDEDALARAVALLVVVLQLHARHGAL